MTFRRFVQAAGITVAVFMMASSATAATITYTTNAAGTIFVGGGLVLTSAGGLGTLTYVPNVSSTSGTPSNINFGDFVLACPLCSVQSGGLGTHFNAFTFDLVITDVTDSNARGTFVGTSSGGSVWSDVSQINVAWLPLQLGPGTSNASFGNFGNTVFTISTPTEIVAPNSGSVNALGDTTVQGHVDTFISGVPEPATFSLIGGALLGLGMLRRKALFRP